MTNYIYKEVKHNLLGFGQANLENFFLEIGEKPFRAKQVLKWIHQRGISDFALMTDLSKSLREKIATVAQIKPPEVTEFQESEDGSIKWLISIGDGNVETVYIPEKGRGTLCVSSQAGCSIDCSFCATGKQGFSRNLTADEIIGQLWLANKYINEKYNGERKISNVVMMGMGEPLLNFENVVESVNLMMNDWAYGLSKRRVTLSTSGIVPMINKLSKVTDVSLAISLHAPNDELRDKLVPVNKKYPISDLLASSKKYLEAMPDTHRRVTVEYTLIAGINDNIEHSHELAELLKNLPCKINLIPFNAHAGSAYKTPSLTTIKKFQSILIERGYTTTVRTTRGDDISAACGQLAGMINDKTSRSRKYKSQNSTVAV